MEAASIVRKHAKIAHRTLTTSPIRHASFVDQPSASVLHAQIVQPASPVCKHLWSTQHRNANFAHSLWIYVKPAVVRLFVLDASIIVMQLTQHPNYAKHVCPFLADAQNVVIKIPVFFVRPVLISYFTVDSVFIAATYYPIVSIVQVTISVQSVTHIMR